MINKNKYIQQIIEYTSNITGQRAMLVTAIAGISICVILVIMGVVFPKGIPTDNSVKSSKENPNSVIETYAGITSEYTANQAIDFVKSAIESDSLGDPICHTEQGKFVAFFSHRKYWKVSFSCPPDSTTGIHVRTEYTYEFNEWDKTVKYTSQQ